MKMTSYIEAEPLRGSSPELDIRLGRRRVAFLSLVSATMLVLLTGLTTVFLAGGLTVLELMMILLFALNLPWIAIGFWNAVIGFILLRLSHNGLRRVLPLAGIGEQPPPPSGRIAIVVPVHDEDPESLFRSLRTTVASLDATGRSDAFDIFLLSDSPDERLASRERVLFAAWKSSDHRPRRLHYRRRRGNAGFKAGNIRDFCERWGAGYDLMIVLDADSVMTGAAILRLVGLMESNPRLGVLQTLVVGLPSASPFARIFQFGMRHGMRAYTAGSAWWQGDAGPYWGHNAIVRLAPFIEHCRLPLAPGRPPLGGAVLSHDQIEAVLMRRAGWEVRVLPIEDGSFEANPPTLLDFIERDRRWCHGNMQYTRLLHLAGAHRLGRLRMLLAILMYSSWPCWLGFCVLGLIQLLAPAIGLPSVPLLPEPASLPNNAALAALGVALFVSVIAMTWAPKLFGLLQALTEAGERRSYGGAGKLLGGALIEFLFSALLAPIVGMAQALFMAGLPFGRRRAWVSQVRADRRVSLVEAARRLWPQTLLGASVAVLLMRTAPGALVWTGPILAGLLLAIPLAVVTTSPTLGRLLMASGLCATPEELSRPAEVRAACRWLPSAPMHAVVAADAGPGRRGHQEGGELIVDRWEDLATTDLGRFDPEKAIAVLPVAAVEQHGPHLPLGTDALICDAILDNALARLDTAARVLRLPTQRVGHSPEHTGFPGTLSLRVETVLALWTDVGRSVAAAGIRKLLLFNSHGGQAALVDIVAQALRSEASMTVARCSYYRFPLPKGWVAEHERRFGLHGGQVETSLMLHIAPHLVRLDHVRDFASSAEPWEAAHRGLQVEGETGIGWRAEDLNREGVTGDASSASAELGARLLEHFAARVAALLEDLRRFPLVSTN